MKPLEQLAEEYPYIAATIHNHDHWNINSGKFTPAWTEAFRAINTCETEELWLDQNDQQQIINHFIHIKFASLKFLSYNQIGSIEMLMFLKAPLLEELNLDSNNIVRVRSLRKCHLPMLEYISIADNPVLDIESICEMGNNLMRLDLQYDTSDTIGQNLNWICRLKMTEMQKIYIEGSKRIRNQKLSNMILAKFLDVSLYERQQP